jgi:hypothetical protein
MLLRINMENPVEGRLGALVGERVFCSGFTYRRPDASDNEVLPKVRCRSRCDLIELAANRAKRT